MYKRQPVWRALADPDKRVVVQVAPAVRAALGEEFGLPVGTPVTGKMASALHEIGFDDVFDTLFSADLTILEEGTCLLYTSGGKVMGEHTHTCCCDHSEEALLKRIGELAAEYKGREGSLIQVLHMAQGIYGSLPLEVQKVIADALDCLLYTSRCV